VFIGIPGLILRWRSAANARHTAGPPVINAFGKPGGRQVTGDFRALKLNARQHLPRERFAGFLIGKRNTC
jgi:hypothetical protein